MHSGKSLFAPDVSLCDFARCGIAKRFDLLRPCLACWQLVSTRLNQSVQQKTRATSPGRWSLRRSSLREAAFRPVIQSRAKQCDLL